MALLFSGTAVGLEPKGRVDVPPGCGSLRAELCGSVQWSVAYTLFAVLQCVYIYIQYYSIYIYTVLQCVYIYIYSITVFIYIYSITVYIDITVMYVLIYSITVYIYIHSITVLQL